MSSGRAFIITAYAVSVQCVYNISIKYVFQLLFHFKVEMSTLLNTEIIMFLDDEDFY